jgi:hypothetical protein
MRQDPGLLHKDELQIAFDATTEFFHLDPGSADNLNDDTIRALGNASRKHAERYYEIPDRP